MSDDSRARLDSLTGLRAVAAGLVFLNHFGDVFQSHFSTFVNDAFASGRSGVSFFFVLSGFVLTWSARSQDTRNAFYARRFARIFPAHFVSWLAAMFLLALAGGTLLLPANLASLFLIQAWFPDPEWHFGGNPVAWSLSCEVFFYAVFPFILPLFDHMNRRHRLAYTGGLLLLAAAIPSFVQILAGPVHTGTWSFYVFPVVRLVEFTIGIALAKLVLRDELPRIPVWGSYTMAAAGLLFAQWGPISWVAVAGMLIPFSFVIVARAQADQRGQASVFANRFCLRLGIWSYSFYLIHELVLRMIGMTLSVESMTQAEVIAVGALSLVIVVLLSAALYLAIERPGESFLRAQMTGKRLP